MLHTYTSCPTPELVTLTVVEYLKHDALSQLVVIIRMREQWTHCF